MAVLQLRCLAAVGPGGTSVLVHEECAPGLVPGWGQPRGAAHRGARKSDLANTSVRFITTWFGKMEIPVASYLTPFSQLSPGASV